MLKAQFLGNTAFYIEVSPFPHVGLSCDKKNLNFTIIYTVEDM